ncbi:hypothetical protein NHX12_005579 [Muraenolepis orangiensis]|uniref:Kinesin motor domain-containing protein n=1 Tax=Muraenolepis orangiensis TaxID=630683 RepID=A0A9Q0IC46_9TELE|nr:hypothetical protein NHX12_005579 [Muraenolepis orangiensis]
MTEDMCKVFVRVRPLNSMEVDGNMSKVVHVVDDQIVLLEQKVRLDVTHRTHNVSDTKDLEFRFDKVFGEDSTQAEVFENTTKAVLEGFMRGFTCTVFAYGASGAGKTHTMMGSAEDPGVMYRTMREMFTLMDQVKEEKEFNIPSHTLR